jgi:hypothetical protein
MTNASAKANTKTTIANATPTVVPTFAVAFIVVAPLSTAKSKTYGGGNSMKRERERNFKVRY